MATPELDYTLFTDESSIHDQYLALGALTITSNETIDAEAVLEEFACSKGFRTRELSWKKCSKREVDRYCQFAELFWHICEAAPSLSFRSVVIDTHQNPLKHEGFRCDSSETGFYKFYHSFLYATIKKAAWRGSSFVFNVAKTSDTYPHRTEVLHRTIEGALRRAFGSRLRRITLRRPHPKENRLHQLCDVLLGAVTYRANNRSSPKEDICLAIESYVRKPLVRDFFPNEMPFNIWWWASKGQRRWALGARGRA